MLLVIGVLRVKPYLCPVPCVYFDDDGVVCNEVPHLCPIIRGRIQRKPDTVQ